MYAEQVGSQAEKRRKDLAGFNGDRPGLGARVAATRARGQAAAPARSAPPGWPEGLPMPDPDPRSTWDHAAATWLLSTGPVPPGYLRHPVLRERAILAALVTRHHITAGLAALQDSYATTRTDLAAYGLPAHTIDEALAVAQAETAALERVAREAWMVAGEVYARGVARGARPAPDDRITPKAPPR